MLDSLSGVPFVSHIEEDRKIRLPWTLAFGTSYRFNDRFTMSLDVSVSDWDQAYIKDGSGVRYSLIDAQPKSDPSSTKLDRTTTVRLGAEYLFIPKELNEKLDYLWTLRGGLVYDEEPATGKPSSGAGVFVPGDGDPEKFYAYTIGLGLLVKQRFNFDIAYQYRHGNGLNKDFVRGPPGFDEDVEQHRVVLSTVIYF